MKTPPRRQTLSYLQNLFAQRGIAPRHRFGQNFLIDLNIHDLIVKAAEARFGDVILEVGPGTGALTRAMADTGATVVAVDIDGAMAGLTAEATRGMINVRVLHLDALAGKNRLNPEVLDNVRSGLAVSPDRRFKLVANLPYNAATPILGNLLVHPELRPERLVATIQLELARRMLAAPDTDDYGALSVLVQALTDATIIRTLPPGVFWPRPKVDSAIVSLVPNPGKIAAVGDLPWFHNTIRQIFLHRRKNLRRVLYSLWRDRWADKEEVDALLDGLGLTGQVRAEALNIPEHIALAAALLRRLGPEAKAEGAEEADEAEPDPETDPDRADASG